MQSGSMKAPAAAPSGVHHAMPKHILLKLPSWAGKMLLDGALQQYQQRRMESFADVELVELNDVSNSETSKPNSSNLTIDGSSLPKQHQLRLCLKHNDPDKPQSLVLTRQMAVARPMLVFSERLNVGIPTGINHSTPRSAPLGLETVINQQYIVRPSLNDARYTNMLKTRLGKSLTHVTQQLRGSNGSIVTPETIRQENAQQNKKRKAAIDAASRGREKRVRGDIDEVTSQIFQLFESRKYMSSKELADATEQPEAFLKSIMNDIGVYIKEGEHRAKWTLKHDDII